MSESAVELYWMPVGAGTSRFQRASLDLWEAIEAARARRPRLTLYHAALKLRPVPGEVYTLELTPAFIGSPVPPLATGPVGVRLAGRSRLFRYQLLCLPGDTLPDEAWAVESPISLSDDPAVAQRILDLASRIPPHTWGRRVRGTGEMWTSDSVVAWLLARSGIDVAMLAPPRGGRAPGWFAGIRIAHRPLREAARR